MEKFSTISYPLIKQAALKHNIHTLDFDDKPKFDEYLDGKSTFNTWYENGFDEELHQEDVEEESGEERMLEIVMRVNWMKI